MLRTITFQVIAFHKELHESRNQPYQTDTFVMSVDGVPENQVGNCVDILSIIFDGCTNVYPVCVMKKICPKYDHKLHDVLASFVKEVNECRVRLRLVLADAPMRAKIRGLKSHSGYHSCDYCFRSPVQANRASVQAAASARRRPAAQADPPEQARGNHLVWAVPAGQLAPHEVRTHSSIADLANDPDFDRIPDSLRRGVKAKSALLGLWHDFDLVRDIPVDAMHTVHKGVGQPLAELTFKSNQSRTRLSEVPRYQALRHLPLAGLNEDLRCMKTPKEFSRRTRNLDVPQLKCEELRNLAIAFFPHIEQAIGPDRPEARLWMTLAFLARIYSMPGEIQIPTEDLHALHQEFHTLWQDVFGVRHLTFSLHQFSHLPILREQGPLTATSCYRFENSYAIHRRAGRPGTCSNAKRTMVMRYAYMAEQKRHRCDHELFISENVTERSDNSLVYVGPGFNFFRVTGRAANNKYACRKLTTRPYICGYDLPFHLTGVQVLAADDERQPLVEIHKSLILGKAYLANLHGGRRVIVALASNILFERN